MQSDLDIYFKMHGKKIEKVLEIVRGRQDEYTVFLEPPTAPTKPKVTNTKQADEKTKTIPKSTKTISIIVRRKFNFDI